MQRDMLQWDRCNNMKVSIIGASGYVGAELVRILSKHPEVELLYTTSRQYAGEHLANVHTNLRSIVDLTFSNENPKVIAEKSDIVFTSTPHTEAMKLILELCESDVKIIDMSGDFRFDKYTDYETWYNQEHFAKELNSKFVYGLPELYRSQIKKAHYVSTPGCYPTSVILALYPLVKSPNIDLDHIVVDSKSATSGAGATPSSFILHSECDGRIKPYNPIKHRHIGEMEQELSKAAKKPIKISFTPHLIPITRGIVLTSHLFCHAADDFSQKMRDAYSNEYFVRFTQDALPDLGSVIGSNYIDIGLVDDKRMNRLVVVSAIDNLVKGAAGQAVQNMNLMCNFPEKTGIDQVPLRP